MNHTTDTPTRSHPTALRLGHGLKHVIVRLYAVGLIVLITWLTWPAFRYLIVSLMFSAPPPPQILDLPTRMDASILERRGPEFAGVNATDNPRSPLAHYHRFEGFIQPDPFNGCTTSGCHNPLPHARRKEVRAFLNMHATSIQCGVCHLESERRPLPLVWYDPESGERRDPPAQLRAYAMLTESDSPDTHSVPSREFQSRIVDLLRAASEESGGSRALGQLADHFASVSVTSEAFENLLEVGRTTLPRHFRGGYGAKLALAVAGEPLLSQPDDVAAIDEYLQRRDDQDSEKLLAAVHALRRDEALRCTDCHREGQSLVDFSAAGYPRARIRALTRPIVFQMVEDISAGRPMHFGLSWIRPSTEKQQKP